jgi:hypothetical protein
MMRRTRWVLAVAAAGLGLTLVAGQAVRLDAQSLEAGGGGGGGEAVAPVGTVTYVGHRAWRHPQGTERRVDLQRGTPVHVGDVLQSEGGPIEIELADGSALRIAAGSRLALTEALFDQEEKERKVSVRLMVGRAWASVTSGWRSDDDFEVRTETAAAGVRGTSFRVDARQDRSTLVRVYQGAVAVVGTAGAVQGTPEPAPERRQVQGPAQVTRQEWEQRVEAMMGVEVSAAGRVGEPAPFDPAAEAEDEWVQWNRERDAAR